MCGKVIVGSHLAASEPLKSMSPRVSLCVDAPDGWFATLVCFYCNCSLFSLLFVIND